MIHHTELQIRARNLTAARAQLLDKLDEVQRTREAIEAELLQVEGAMTFLESLLEQSKAEEDERKAQAEAIEKKRQESPATALPQNIPPLTMEEIREELEANAK